MPQGPSLHSKFQMSSSGPIEISFQMHQKPARNLSFQMFQSPLVIPRSPMKSSLSVPERDLCPQESQGPSGKSSIQMQLGLVMDPGLPILRSLLMHSSHQIPSRSSVRSGFQGSLGPMVWSPSYGDRRVSLVTPRKHRKIRTVYTEEHKCVLKKHFHKCTYPSREQRMALAVLVGVTANEIQVCFSSLFLTATISTSPSPCNQTPDLCALKFLGQLGQLWKVHACGAELHILLQPGYQHG